MSLTINANIVDVDVVIDGVDDCYHVILINDKVLISTRLIMIMIFKTTMILIMGIYIIDIWVH